MAKEKNYIRFNSDEYGYITGVLDCPDGYRVSMQVPKQNYKSIKEAKVHIEEYLINEYSNYCASHILPNQLKGEK